MTYPDIFGNTVFSRGFRVEAQRDIMVIFEELFSVINMYGWHGQGLLILRENVIIMYLSIVLDIALGLIWVTIWYPILVAKPLRCVAENIYTKSLFSKVSQVKSFQPAPETLAQVFPSEFYEISKLAQISDAVIRSYLQKRCS